MAIELWAASWNALVHYRAGPTCILLLLQFFQLGRLAQKKSRALWLELLRPLHLWLSPSLLSSTSRLPRSKPQRWRRTSACVTSASFQIRWPNVFNLKCWISLKFDVDLIPSACIVKNRRASSSYCHAWIRTLRCTCTRDAFNFELENRFEHTYDFESSTPSLTNEEQRCSAKGSV